MQAQWEHKRRMKQKGESSLDSSRAKMASNETTRHKDIRTGRT